MKFITQQQIDHFLDCKSMAIVGASRNEKSFSAQVAQHLTKIGYDIWYVNPAFEKTDTKLQKVQCISSLPSEVKHLLLITPARQTATAISDADVNGIKNLWIQQYSETPSALELTKRKGMNVVHNQCIFMFAKPEGIHKFHYRVNKLFGQLPKLS